MKRPSLLIYAIGNSASALGITIYCGIVTYQWWLGQIPSGWVPVLTLVAVVVAIDANQKLTAYGNWNRAWSAMSGDGSGRRRWPYLRLWLALCTWLFMVQHLWGLNYQVPRNQILLGWFVAVHVVALACIWWRRRKTRAASQPRTEKPSVVSIAISVPRHSPGAREIIRALPAYCARL
jgi:hypothetical protein